MIKPNNKLSTKSSGIIFEVIFWIGFLLIILSFLYNRWFIISVSLGVILMVISLLKEGFNLKSMDSSFFKKRDNKFIHLNIFIVGLLILVIYGIIYYTPFSKLQGVFNIPLSLSITIYIIIAIFILVILFFLTRNFWKRRLKLRSINKNENELIKKKLEQVKKEVKVENKITKKPKSKKYIKIIIYIILLVAIVYAFMKYGTFLLKFWYFNVAIGLIFGIIMFRYLRIFMVYRSKTKARDSKLTIEIKNRISSMRTKDKTDLDILLELIKEKGKLSISVISNSFGVNREVAEEWGKVLETGNLIKLEYPPIGDVELCQK